MFSNSAGLHSPRWAREETWGKSFLAVARGPVTATSSSGRPFSYKLWFPVTIPQATARWDSPQISSHFYRGLLTWLEHGAIMIRSGDRGLKSKRVNDFLFPGHLTIIATTSTRLSPSRIFEFQTSDVSRAVALDVGFRK